MNSLKVLKFGWFSNFHRLRTITCKPHCKNARDINWNNAKVLQ